VADAAADSGSSAADAASTDAAAADGGLDTTVVDASAPSDATLTPDTIDASGGDVAVADAEAGIVIPPGLHGQVAPEPLPLPDAQGVVDTANSAVDTSVLLGQWTVMWFYPAASTAG
jgi:hypothetical protein